LGSGPDWAVGQIGQWARLGSGPDWAVGQIGQWASGPVGQWASGPVGQCPSVAHHFPALENHGEPGDCWPPWCEAEWGISEIPRMIRRSQAPLPKKSSIKKCTPKKKGGNKKKVEPRTSTKANAVENRTQNWMYFHFWSDHQCISAENDVGREFGNLYNTPPGYCRNQLQ